jgi:hypothetical protein
MIHRNSFASAAVLEYVVSHGSGDDKIFHANDPRGGEDRNIWRMASDGSNPPLSLIVSKQQLFKSHPSHLPKVAFVPIHSQPALALVIEGQGHIKHRIAFIVLH